MGWSELASELAPNTQRLTREPAAKTAFMTPTHKEVRVGWRLQPGAEPLKCIRERILRRDTQAAEAIGDGG